MVTLGCEEKSFVVKRQEAKSSQFYYGQRQYLSALVVSSENSKWVLTTYLRGKIFYHELCGFG